jgi:hypothetical protein
MLPDLDLGNTKNILLLFILLIKKIFNHEPQFNLFFTDSIVQL